MSDGLGRSNYETVLADLRRRHRTPELATDETAADIIEEQQRTIRILQEHVAILEQHKTEAAAHYRFVTEKYDALAAEFRAFIAETHAAVQRIGSHGVTR